MTKQTPQPKAKPGPEASRLKIKGDWEKAVGKVVAKPRPETKKGTK